VVLRGNARAGRREGRVEENTPKEILGFLRDKNSRAALTCLVVNAKRSATGAFVTARIRTNKIGMPQLFF